MLRRPAALALMAAALLLPFAGCGGGGGGGGGTASGGSGGGGAPIVDPVQLTQDLLADCGGRMTVLGIQQVVNQFSGVVAGQTNGFTILTAQITNTPGLIIPWEFDAGGDGTPEITGRWRFEDAGGSPNVPWTPAELMPIFTQGIAGLPAVLAIIPDGTQMITEITGDAGTPSVTGSMRASFASQQPTNTSGDVSVAGASCTSEATWSNVPINNLTAPYPTAVFSTRITQDTDVALGTLTTNGTNTAVADVSLNGAANTQWDVNLDDGTVTQQP